MNEEKNWKDVKTLLTQKTLPKLEKSSFARQTPSVTATATAASGGSSKSLNKCVKIFN